jgi:hypothetical protein
MIIIQKMTFVCGERDISGAHSSETADVCLLPVISRFKEVRIISHPFPSAGFFLFVLPAAYSQG